MRVSQLQMPPGSQGAATADGNVNRGHHTQLSPPAFNHLRNELGAEGGQGLQPGLWVKVSCVVMYCVT